MENKELQELEEFTLEDIIKEFSNHPETVEPAQEEPVEEAAPEEPAQEKVEEPAAAEEITEESIEETPAEEPTIEFVVDTAEEPAKESVRRI